VEVAPLFNRAQGRFIHPPTARAIQPSGVFAHGGGGKKIPPPPVGKKGLLVPDRSHSPPPMHYRIRSPPHTRIPGTKDVDNPRNPNASPPPHAGGRQQESRKSRQLAAAIPAHWPPQSRGDSGRAGESLGPRYYGTIRHAHGEPQERTGQAYTPPGNLIGASPGGPATTVPPSRTFTTAPTHGCLAAFFPPHGGGGAGFEAWREGVFLRG